MLKWLKTLEYNQTPWNIGIHFWQECKDRHSHKRKNDFIKGEKYRTKKYNIWNKEFTGCVQKKNDNDKKKKSERTWR